MAKKYIPLGEAAGQLNLSEEQLKALRKKGDICGFADRGNWKFRQEDIDEYARTLQDMREGSNRDMQRVLEEGAEDSEGTEKFFINNPEYFSSKTRVQEDLELFAKQGKACPVGALSVGLPASRNSDISIMSYSIATASSDEPVTAREYLDAAALYFGLITDKQFKSKTNVALKTLDETLLRLKLFALDIPLEDLERFHAAPAKKAVSEPSKDENPPAETPPYATSAEDPNDEIPVMILDPADDESPSGQSSGSNDGGMIRIPHQDQTDVDLPDDQGQESNAEEPDYQTEIVGSVTATGTNNNINQVTVNVPGGTGVGGTESKKEKKKRKKEKKRREQAEADLAEARKTGAETLEAQRKQMQDFIDRMQADHNEAVARQQQAAQYQIDAAMQQHDAERSREAASRNNTHSSDLDPERARVVLAALRDLAGAAFANATSFSVDEDDHIVAVFFPGTQADMRVGDDDWPYDRPLNYENVYRRYIDDYPPPDAVLPGSDYEREEVVVDPYPLEENEEPATPQTASIFAQNTTPKLDTMRSHIGSSSMRSAGLDLLKGSVQATAPDPVPEEPAPSPEPEESAEGEADTSNSGNAAA